MMARDLVSLPLLGPATLPGRRAVPKEILTMRTECASLSLGPGFTAGARPCLGDKKDPTGLKFGEVSWL